ncbi:MAG: ATP-dependent zinc metalloprotease FtsH [Anaerolineae bacterium]|jgi:cell division protease FtsH|nr:ATP-dependent zinc metalloprotease FtsH [Anaerolineae bacterium]
MQFPNNNNNPRKDDDPQSENPNPQQDWRKWIWPVLIVLGLTWFFLIMMSGTPSVGTGTPTNYSVVYQQAQNRNVRDMVFRGAEATGVFISPVNNANGQPITNFSVIIPTEVAQGQLLEVLNANEIVFRFDANETPALLTFLFQLAPFLLIIAFLVWTARRAQRQMGSAMGFGRTQAREYTVERPQVTFNDVAGQDAAKVELTEIVDFLKEPEKYIALGARIPRGVLLIGPPGTGKTLLARAVAGEARVSFFSIAASEFVEMFVGVGASRVRDLFKRARDNAPSIVFIDEIDAVGRQRGAGLGGGHDEREQTLNQMLAEMDGFDQTESVIIMAATNRHDVLDPALLRPGRFDRQVTVGLPDRKGRLEILKIHTRGKPLDSNVNLDDLARGTIGFSGADLSNLCNESALNAARRNAKRITMRDFSNAFDRIVLGTESPPLSDSHERKVVAYHEAGHAVVAALLPNSDPVLKVTIVPRGQALGVTAYMPESDRRNYSRGYLYTKIMTLLGGRAAEEIIIKEVTTGAENDLRRATDLARRMVSQFGMSDSFGLLNFGDDERQPFLGYSLSQGKSYSEETAAEVDAEVRRLIKQAHDQTIALLTENKDKLIALAEALLVQEVIEQDEMWRVIGMENDPRYEKFAGTHFTLGKGSQVESEPDAEVVPAPEPELNESSRSGD